MNKYLVYLCLFCLLACFSTAHARDLVLATTTSTKSSGLLDRLIPAFEKESGYHVKLIIVGTGKALRMGRQGKVDVLLVHSPEAENKFIEDSHGVLRKSVMKNDFIVVGPAADPAQVNELQDVKQAFMQIKNSNSLFISRADDSGTHKKEMIIWHDCEMEPYGDWYYELGAGMGKTILVADKEQAYTLVDRSSWLALRKSTELVLHVEGDPVLDNPYSVIAVNPQRFRKVNYLVAKKFIEWITGKQGQKIINDLTVDGEKLFTVTVNKD